MSLEQRVNQIEEAILIMKDLLVSHDKRLEDYLSALNQEREERKEGRKDFDFKLNALIDIQLKNETDIADLKNAAAELKETSVKLSEASKSQLKRIENLENN